jgi:DNA-binding MarR family transcriptional regulator
MTKLRIANLLGALSGEVVERLQTQMRRHPNSTDSMSAALNVLAMWEGCSNAELAGVLGLSHSAAVRLLDKLEAEGLVVSAPGKDQRTVALSLTASGRARAREILVERCAVLVDVIDVLTPAERDVLGGLLEKLLRGVTTSMDHAGHICRLCDTVACPEDKCPVHQQALALAR